MKYIRMEVYEANNQLVFIREKPVFAQTQKGIRATHTRLLNWAQREFPEWRDIDIQQIERN
jgi:hypothetical protein